MTYNKIFLALLLSLNFISSNDYFNGGSSDYLISSVPGTIENSPYRYVQLTKIYTPIITGKGIENIPSSPIFWGVIIFLILVLLTIIFIILKKKKDKKELFFINNGRMGE